MRFSVDSPEITTPHKSTLWFGLHETEERALVKRWLPADLPVVELGGGLGVVACLINRRLAQPDHHVVVEPHPEMRRLLALSRELNRCRYRVIPAALAYDCQTATFGRHACVLASKLGEPHTGGHRTVLVPAVTLANVLDSAEFGPCSVVADIEGAEADLIERELDTLRERCRFFVVEIHPSVLGEERCERIVGRLVDAGFRLRERVGSNWAFGRDDDA
jgi:FkbM family methyltransferase